MKSKKKMTRPRVPTREELEAVIAVMYEPLRTYTTVAAWSGLRLFEVAALEPRDVRFTDNGMRLHVRHGKGDKERYATLLSPGHAAMYEALALIPAYRSADRPWVWRTGERNQWDRRSVGRHWVKARAAAGVDACFHVATRHFHATWLWNRGVAMEDIAVQLGHFDAYNRPNIELIRAVYGHLDHSAALDRVAVVA